MKQPTEGWSLDDAQSKKSLLQGSPNLHALNLQKKVLLKSDVLSWTREFGAVCFSHAWRNILDFNYDYH